MSRQAGALERTRSDVRPGVGDGQVALVHDHLMQKGGAERVALLMTEAFPSAPIYTSFYDAEKTYPEFSSVDIRTSWLDRVSTLRRNFRIALPLMAPVFSRMRPSAAVTICSSAGWAHGARPRNGRTVVYCHAPARWLYQSDRYLGRGSEDGYTPSASARLARWALALLGPHLRRWDRASAGRAQRYVANSTLTAKAVESVYGIKAEVLPPPPGLEPDGPETPPVGLEQIEPGFWLCVARLLPYKNVDVVTEAVRRRRGEKLVVVGDGPQLEYMRARASDEVHFVGAVHDDELRWLYRRSRGLLAASYEDFGLTPLEAASFGKPSVVLRWGGFLDTVDEDLTGTFFDHPDPTLMSEAMDRLSTLGISEQTLLSQAEKFSADRFVKRLREVVADELVLAG
ncbi:MAG TPA: glycosyltransferase [Acidimicrobiales bacterium]|nr:glycosyltransferase [Acidimicrobiales bacterium]